MNNFFLKIYKFFQAHKALLWVILLGIVALLAWSASRISFVEDISSFLPNNADNKRVNEAYQNIGGANKIVVSISVSSSEYQDTTNSLPTTDYSLPTTHYSLLSDAATRFAEILQEKDSAGHIKELMYEIDNEQITQTTNFIIENLPFYLTEEDYARIDTLIQSQNIENQLKADKNLLMSPMGGFVRGVILQDPLMFSQNALKSLEGFKQNDNYNNNNGFLFNNKGECLVIISSKYPVSETANNKLLANEIYNAVNQTKSEFNNEIEIIPFGAALISITNADQIKKDSILAVTIALILILALLFYFFRNLKSLFFIALSILFGALFSLGVIVLFKSTVSIIAIGIASIIFGIAINYPLHFLAHFRHNQDVKLTLKEIVNPLLIGNITTVGAFLALLFISSPAMHDLGLFASFLLVGTIFFVLIFLPQFIAPRHSRESGNPLKQQIAGQARNDGYIFKRLSEFSPERNKFIVLIFLVFTVVLFFFSFGTKFETNLQSINYMTTEQRTEMNKLIAENQGKGKTLYVVAEGKNIDEALENYENNVLPRLTRHSEEQGIAGQARNDGAVSGIGNFFPSKDVQKEKIERWNSFWEWNDGAEHECSKKDLFTGNLKALSQKQGFNENVFDYFISLLNTDFQPQNFEYFTPVFKNMGENYFSISDDKTLIYTVLNCDENQKQAIENQITENNPYIFTFDDTSIGAKMVDALSNDFNNVLFICAFIVFVFLLFSFGRIEIAVLTFIPMAMAWIWILGLMNIFDLKFNIVNIILATFIFGQGDDYAIFVTEGLIYEYTYRKKMLASFKKSIILSATILFIAIGMLIFAKHPAMRSLAELTIVGMISVVLCAYLFPPLIFKYLVYKKEKNRLMPITLWNWLKTVYSFFVFFVCSIFVTLAGFFILTIGGKSKKHKMLYHRFLCAGFRTLAKMIPQIKHKIHNPHNENFEKPAIIICNHQSHLDLLYTLMLSPKIITLTNKWVWDSPFYGWIIRYADFLPIADGLEQHADTLKKFVDDGYSILVFPEGTRSPDCSIGRFHKGAFYLAERFNLDILPVIIHGIGHVFPKQEFMLRKGEINVEIHSRRHCGLDPQTPVLLGDSDFSDFHHNQNDISLLETSKYFRKFFQKKYSELAKQIETPEYFADRLLKNYYYKGAEIQRKAKKRIKYQLSNTTYKNLQSNDGKIEINDVILAQLYALSHSDIQVIASDEDADFFEIAKNCSINPINLKFKEDGE